MEAQQKRESFTKRNNEVVIDLTSVAPRLPDAIEGFFSVKGSPDYKINEAKDVYYRFLEYYNLDRQHAPPLMVVDMESSRPFALDADLVDVANTVPHR